MDEHCSVGKKRARHQINWMKRGCCGTEKRKCNASPQQSKSARERMLWFPLLSFGKRKVFLTQPFPLPMCSHENFRGLSWVTQNKNSVLFALSAKTVTESGSSGLKQKQFLLCSFVCNGQKHVKMTKMRPKANNFGRAKVSNLSTVMAGGEEGKGLIEHNGRQRQRIGGIASNTYHNV